MCRGMGSHSQKLKILQVSTHDHFGGAEAIMQSLHQGHLLQGSHAVVAFGERHRSESEGIFLDRERRAPWSIRTGIRLSHWIRRQIPPAWKPAYKRSWGIAFSQPLRAMKRMQGYEDFEHPVSRQLLDLYQKKYSLGNPDWIHFHTFHGDFFDLRYLPELSQKTRILVTLHDEWLMTGHCGYSLDCERWKIGCGHCPYLDSYPAIARDQTRFNHALKRDILSRTRFEIVTPSKWLKNRFEASPLRPLAQSVHHIPNGINLEIFFPGERAKARESLGLPKDRTLFLFAARGGRSNRYKDFETIQKAIQIVSDKDKSPLMLVVLGEASEEIRTLGVPVRFESIHGDPQKMATYYQASDFYLHAANAENYPTVILEAMACGCAVIATEVGGIPEQIRNEVDGLLVPQGDSKAMAQGILRLLQSPELVRSFQSQALLKAKSLFDEKEMWKKYQSLFDSATVL